VRDADSQRARLLIGARPWLAAMAAGIVAFWIAGIVGVEGTIVTSYRTSGFHQR
jgi:hypothetical protein